MDVPKSIDGALSRAYRGGAVLLLAGVLAIAVDLPVSRARPDLSPLDPRVQLWTLPELFGDGLGVLLITMAVFLVDTRTRRFLPRVLSCAFASGLAADTIKLLVLRTRPRAFNFQTGVFASFHGPLPWALTHDAGVSLEGKYLSFPSAHTATAVGLAVGLSWRYPRGRPLFALLAFMVACQRIAVGAHFLSDTLFGAAVGCLVSALCVDRRGFGCRFDALEAKLSRLRHGSAGKAVTTDTGGSRETPVGQPG